MSVIRIVRKFRSVLSRHQRLRIIELALLMIIGGFLETLSVSLMLPFMNAVMNPEDVMGNKYVKALCDVIRLESSRQFLTLLALVLAFAYIIKNIYLILEYNIQYRFVCGNMFSMQSKLLKTFIHRPYEYFLNVNSGEIMRIINADTINSFTLLSTLLGLFTDLVVSVMLVATVFVIMPFTAFCTASVLVVLLVITSSFVKPRMRAAGREAQRTVAGMNKWLLQSINGIKELKVMSKEKFFQEQYDTYGWSYVQAHRRDQIYSIIPRYSIEAVCMGAVFIVIAVLINGGTDLKDIIPVLSAVAMASIRLLPSVNRISMALGKMAFTEPMLDKMIENLQNLSGNDNVSVDMDISYSSDYEKKGNVPIMNKGINLRDVSFCYPGGEKNVLEHANMKVAFGESVGIVGCSGAGKTTAVDIILGLLHPQKGGVYIDDVDVHLDISQWLSQIGYIPQSIFMLDDTIRANVAFGEKKKDIDDVEIWKALKDASLDEFVRTLPKELDTEIGERGMRLSGGQRQRIGIARALYRNPTVLIFDEATSALDNETEAAIMDSIHNLHGQKTMIIIAHRLSTIEGCDHIFRVDNGKIEVER